MSNHSDRNRQADYRRLMEEFVDDFTENGSKDVGPSIRMFRARGCGQRCTIILPDAVAHYSVYKLGAEGVIN